MKHLMIALISVLFLGAGVFVFFKTNPDIKTGHGKTQMLSANPRIEHLVSEKRNEIQKSIQSEIAKIDTTEQAVYEILSVAFRELHESSRLVSYPSVRKHLLQTIGSEPRMVEALSQALKDKNKAKEIFGDKQAEARYFGVQVLSYLHENGESGPLLDTLSSFQTSPSENIFNDKGRKKDYLDLVEGYLSPYRKDMEIFARDLEEIAENMGYFRLDKQLREDVYSIYFRIFGTKYFEKTTDILKVLE